MADSELRKENLGWVLNAMLKIKTGLKENWNTSK